MDGLARDKSANCSFFPKQTTSQVEKSNYLPQTISQSKEHTASTAIGRQSYKSCVL
jgi:hypothetical protein